MSTALRTYYRGHNLVGMRDGVANAQRYFHFDHQGTVQCLTDSGGNVTDRFASDAWGVPVKRTGSSINRQWYIGNLGYYRQVDQALDYVRARYLQAFIGRWISPDPQLDGQLPLSSDSFETFRLVFAPYEYVKNRPTLLVDASGLQAPNVTVPNNSNLNCLKGVPLNSSTQCRNKNGFTNCEDEVKDTLRQIIDQEVDQAFTCPNDPSANKRNSATRDMLKAALYCIALAETRMDPSAVAKGTNETAYGLFQIGDTHAKRHCGSTQASCAMDWQVRCALNIFKANCAKGGGGPGTDRLGRRRGSVLRALRYWQPTQGDNPTFNQCMKDQGEAGWRINLNAFECDPCYCYYGY